MTREAAPAIMARAGHGAEGFTALAPALFVLLWSTGFIVARVVAPHADPFTFLTARFVMSAAVFTLVAVACGVRWPQRGRDVCVAVASGALIHGFYLAGVFWAIRHGLPAGVAALVSGLQPLATAVVAALLLGEHLRRRRWAGVALGLIGVALVVAPALAATQGVPPAALLAALGGTLSITLGTVWQKRAGGAVDLRANAALQFVGATLVVAPLAVGTEPMLFDLSWPLWACLLWSVFGLSVAAITLMLMLLARDAAADFAALLYLVPPVSAVLAYLALGETLTPVQIAGMAVTALAVKAVRVRPAAARANPSAGAALAATDGNDRSGTRPAAGGGLSP